MATQVEIYNLALTRLGHDRLIDPSDAVEAAYVLESIWPMTRDAVLASYPWRFAIKRTSLAALASVPAGTEWTLQYTLPDECLRIVQVGEAWSFYEPDLEVFNVEGGKILTNESSPLFIRYVQRVTNTGLYPAQFARVVAMQLAMDACEKITNSSAKLQQIEQAYAMAVLQAKRQNAIERPPQRLVDSDWIAARGD